MTANTLQSFDAVTNNVPVVAVAAIFQKDPQVFLTHPESKIQSSKISSRSRCSCPRRASRATSSG
jgi:hypothetical protein